MIQQKHAVFFLGVDYTMLANQAKLTATVMLAVQLQDPSSPYFSFFSGGELSFTTGNLFLYIKIMPPLISSWLSGME